MTLTPGVEQFLFKPAPDLDAGITISECIGKHVRKQHAEQCRSKYAAFIDAIGYGKRIRWFCSVELADDGNKLSGQPKLAHDLPGTFSAVSKAL